MTKGPACTWNAAPSSRPERSPRSLAVRSPASPPCRRRPARRTRAMSSSCRCPTSATAACGCTSRRDSPTAPSTTPRSPSCCDDGTVLPGRHDGMGAFPGPKGNSRLVRNHEVNVTPDVGAFGDPDEAYDPMAGGGTTTVQSTPHGRVVWSRTSLNGTLMNCSGGVMPWGSWVTCEETINGPDVGADFTGTPNTQLHKPHGYIFEVPARGKSNRRPITAAGQVPARGGRVRPEARSAVPHRGQLRVRLRLLPLHPTPQPDADREARQPGRPGDAQESRTSRRSTSRATSSAAGPTRSSG